MPFHYFGGVCFVAVIFVCKDQLTWKLPSPCFILLFFTGGVCGSYIGVVRLPVKMYERVKNGNVYKFDSLVL